MIEPRFIEGPRGRLFLFYRSAEGRNTKGVVLFIPPFAEELNKSRRMLALAARALNGCGYATVLPDLYGTGDSAGDFKDADWDGWLDDLRATLSWIESRHDEPVHLLALRAGALLGSRLIGASALQSPTLVLWNPVIHGQQVVTQFLRLRMAGMLGMAGGENTRELRDRLATGESLEIAGYTLSSGLAHGLDAATLAPDPAALPGRVVWLEVSSREEPVLTPVSQRAVTDWEAAGVSVDARPVHGDPFWSTVELVDAPALVAATEAAFQCL